MRRVAGVGILLGLLVGCLPWQASRGTGWMQSMNPFAGHGGDKVVVRWSLIDQPAGDPFLTTGLWTKTLKPLPPEMYALLGENGLRVGQITGQPPSEFIELVRSEESAVKPTDSTINVGETKVLPVNGPMGTAKFQSWATIGGEAQAQALKDAEFAFAVTPTLADNGKVKLTCELRVQHGGRILGWKPTADATSFTWLDQKSQERFPKLTFEATIGASDYLVVGPTDTPAATLGGECFVTMADGRGRMRVLVVQAVAVKVVSPAAAAPGKKTPASVAARAATPIARGQWDGGH